MLLQGPVAGQGFYGGFSVRPKNLDPGLVLIEPDSLSWTKPVNDEPSQQARIYGGYRLQSDLGVEAALTEDARRRAADLGAAGIQSGVGEGFGCHRCHVMQNAKCRMQTLHVPRCKSPSVFCILNPAFCITACERAERRAR